MNTDFANELILSHNVLYLNPGWQNDFDSMYLEIRKKEHRVPDDETIIKLPDTTFGSPYETEWKYRKYISKRVLQEIYKLKPSTALDIGCGNGWFTHKVSEHVSDHTYGLDINKEELEQASKLFSSARCKFIYGDLFDSRWPVHYFDLITLNSTVQYFPSLNMLINRLKDLLTSKGEIHILDSPMYATKEEAEKGRARSAHYYSSIGYPNFINYYHHHTFADLQEINYTILYDPSQITNRFYRKIFLTGSPFYWIRITQ